MMREQPPQFPVFPMPPPSAAAVPPPAVVSDVVQSLTEQFVAKQAAGSPAGEAATTTSDRDVRKSERERIAEDAIRSSIEHVVHEYVRQDLAERMGTADPPSASNRKLECYIGNPQHTTRVAVLLAVSFFGVSTLLNTFSVTALIAGCTLVYVSDSLGYQKGSIIGLILALAAFGGAILVSNAHALTSLGPLCLLLNTVLGLLSVTATMAMVHYKWLQAEFPALIHFFERVSVSVGPIAALPPLSSICVAFLSAKHACLGFVVAMCVLHDQFYSKLRSSFLFERVQSRHRKPLSAADAEDQEEEEVVAVVLTGRFEAALFTVLTLLLPSITYLVLQSNWSPETNVMHLMNILATVGVPVLYLFWNPRRSLWFLRPDHHAGGRTEVTPPAVGEMLRADPLGLWEYIGKARSTVLSCGYLLVLHWGVYRLLHSRYQYLFVGAPPPFNGLLLLLAAYALTGMIVIGARIIKQDSKDNSATAETPADQRASADRKRFALDRVVVMLLSVAFALLVAAAAGMPQFFYPMSALAASSFNAYLLDRRNTSNFTLFCCCSSLLLMWWMYRTFSFIVMELHVLGESATVPTPVVAVSVLWCYLLGCIAFALSFSENKRPFHYAMFLHSIKVAWVEHVLYSQKEAGSYPAIFVYATSGIGIWLCMRLYKSEVMDVTATSMIAASYVAKIFTFLCEVCGAAYAGESEAALSRGSNIRRSIEVAAGWWAMLLIAYVAVSMELERRVGNMETVKIRSNVIALIIGASVVALSSIENIQRAASEFIAQRYLSQDESLHAAVGSALMTFSLLTAPVLTRHTKAFPSLQRIADLCKVLGFIGIALFALRPTQLVAPSQNVNVDFEIVHTDAGRLIALCGIAMAVAARFLPMLKAPVVVRVVYWLVATTLMSIGLTVLLIPAGNPALVLSISCFVFFSVLTIDVCHYRDLLNSEAWIVYGVSVASMVLSFVALGRVDLQKHSGANLLLLWEMHETGRMTLLGVAGCVNVFISVLLKFRLSERSLLPSPKQLTHEGMVQQIGIIGNYTTLLSVVVMTILNLWAGGADPMIFIASAFILLLLVDDEMLFFELGRGSNRYIPVLGYILAALWGTLVFDAYQQAAMAKGGFHVWAVVRSILFALPVLPSHVSLMSVLLWGKSKGGTRVGAVLLFVLLDLMCLIFATRPKLQWLALVGIAGQLCRLYEAQFWKKSHSAVL